MDAFKDMMFERNIDAGRLFVVENTVPEFRKYAGFFTRKVFYGMDVSGKEIIFYIHAPESVLRYGILIWERVL